MPTYDYRCEASGKVYEVRHPMAVSVSTWGQLCEVAGPEVIPDPDIYPKDSPVSKILNTGGVVQSHVLKNPDAPPCQTGQACCGGGVCGM